MGMTIYSLRAMFVPLQGLLAWLARTPQVHRPTPAWRPASAGQRVRCTRALPANRHHDNPRRPLRVVRVVDSQAARGAGRMVISGRMADVCAELDRLAALEAAAA